MEAERVALAGVLEQTDKESLGVQPEFLRSALLKDTFFPVNELTLPWKICHALINSAHDPILRVYWNSFTLAGGPELLC